MKSFSSLYNATLHSIASAFYTERNIEKTLSFLADDFQFISTAENNNFYNKTQLVDLLEQHVSHFKHPLEVEFIKPTLIELNERSALICTAITIANNDGTVKGNCTYSFRVEKCPVTQADICKMTSLHHTGEALSAISIRNQEIPSVDSTVSTHKENKKTTLDKQAKIPLEIALNLFDITIWEYDLADETFQYIAQSNDQLLSFPQKTAINDVLSKIAVSDVDKQKIITCMQNVQKTKTADSVDIASTRNNEEKWIRIKALPILNNSELCIKILGTLSDITAERERQQKFSEEITNIMQATEKGDAFSCFLCNLSENQITKNNSQYDYIEKIMKSPSFDDFMMTIASHIADTQQRTDFLNTFTRELLLKHFSEGKSEFDFELLYDMEEYGLRWLNCHIKMYQHPLTNDIFLHGESHDVTEQIILNAIAKGILSREYDFLCCIDIKNNNYFTINKDATHSHFADGHGVNFTEAFTHFARHAIVNDNIDDFLGKHSLEQIRVELEQNQTYSTIFYKKKADNTIATQRLEYTYIDRKNSLALCTQADITELLREQESKSIALATALKSANEAMTAKTDFLSRISHELRTPINVIMGMTDIAENSGNDFQLINNSIEKISTASTELLTLVNSILDISDLDSERLMLKNEFFSFEQFVQGITATGNAKAKQKNIQFILSCDDKISPYLYGDKGKIWQVIDLILDNSSKFTPTNGSITLKFTQTSITETRIGLCISIKDTGCGIDKEFLLRVFEPFTKQHTGINSPYSGIGVGLPICKNIIQLMGGTIKAYSENNIGSEFVINIWLDIAQESDFQAQLSEEKNKKESAPVSKKPAASLEALRNKVQQAKTIHTLSSEKSTANPGVKTRILLVEDHPLNIEVAKLILIKNGFTVEVAENGKIAVDLYIKNPDHYYDAILMDIRMPIMDGIEATEKIRASDKQTAKTIPIIAFTANTFKDDIQNYLEVGMTAHLAKPINAALLCKTIQDLIQIFD